MDALEVYVDGQKETVHLKDENDLSTVASLLKEKGHSALNVAFLHIRVNRIRVCESESINPGLKYHFCKLMYCLCHSEYTGCDSV